MTKRLGTPVAIALFLMLAAGPVLAQRDVTITPDVVYGHKAGMALTFDVFQPAEGANGIGILHMVSGGWVSSWAPPEQAVARYEFLLEEGFTVFAVRHGSSPRFNVPEAFSDVKRAARYLNLHAAEFGVDPDRLGVWGGSAGGHLSLLLGFTADEGDPSAEDPIERAPSRIAAVVAYYPPTDLRQMTGPSVRFPALDFDRELSESVSPILHVTAQAPPVLLIHGDSDTLVGLAHSTRLFDVLEQQRITSDLIVIEGAGHGFQGDDLRTAREALTHWFGMHLLD